MNKFILIAMDRESYTNEELKKNTGEADAAHYAASIDTDPSNEIAAGAAAGAAYYAYTGDSTYLEQLLGMYFRVTSESRQTYLDAIEGSK